MDPNTNNPTSSEIPPVPQLMAAGPAPPPKPIELAPPTVGTTPGTATEERDPVKDAKYAESLIQMANMKYEMEQAKNPKKQIMSTKKMIYLGLIIVSTILSLILTPLLLKSKSGKNSEDTTKQLLDSSNYVKDLKT